jgi:hypothetical protein
MSRFPRPLFLAPVGEVANSPRHSSAVGGDYTLVASLAGRLRDSQRRAITSKQSRKEYSSLEFQRIVALYNLLAPICRVGFWFS